jgi:hypothetical protein
VSAEATELVHHGQPSAQEILGQQQPNVGVTLSYSINSFVFIFSGLKITGHGNPNSNLESHCTYHHHHHPFHHLV